MNSAIRLDHWCLVSRSAPGFQPPERERICLHGIVTGHERCADGKEITTSLVVGRDGNSVVTKSGSHYELGDMEEEYELRYPGARARLLAALRELGPCRDGTYEI